MSEWLNLGEILRVNARKFADKLAVKDVRRQLNYAEYNAEVCKLANGFSKMGINKGDKVAIISCNNVEFYEFYAAAAKSGFIAVPINWRLTADDTEYIANNCEAKAIIVEDEFIEKVESIREKLTNIPAENYISIGDKTPEKYRNFNDVVEAGSDAELEIKIANTDTWIILYTSGTTGQPKGVVRSHESYIAFFFITLTDFGFLPEDYGLFLMPLCHVNTTFFAYPFTYMGGAVYLQNEKGFNPVEILELIDKEKITFSSMIPTHYNLLLN